MPSERCRVCDGEESKEVLTKDHGGQRSTWRECEGCGVHRIAPYPSEEDLAAYYDDGYQDKECPGSVSVSHRLRFSPEYQSTLFAEFGYSLADVGIEPGELAEMTILDYGCADGVFLDFSRSMGASPERLFGIDISPEMVERAKAKGYRAASLGDHESLYDEKYDLVTLWDTLEHLLDPRAVIAELKRAVGPETRLVAQTPRIGLLAGCLGESFEHYLPLEHVHLYPRRTFVRVFEEMGFAVDRVASFGANAPAAKVPQPYKGAFDRLAKSADQGATQVGLFRLC